MSITRNSVAIPGNNSILAVSVTLSLHSTRIYLPLKSSLKSFQHSFLERVTQNKCFTLPDDRPRLIVSLFYDVSRSDRSFITTRFINTAQHYLDFYGCYTEAVAGCDWFVGEDIVHSPNTCIFQNYQRPIPRGNSLSGLTWALAVSV